MQLDGRGSIFTIWLTLLLGILSTSFVVDYYSDRRPDAPKPLDLGEASTIIAGLWLAVFIAAIVIVLLGWYQNRREGIGAVLIGYFTGAMLQLALLQDLQPFLSNARSDFDWFWSIITLQGLPSYSAFLLLVFIGGGIIGVILIYLAHMFKHAAQLPTLIPHTAPEPRVLFGAFTLSIITLLLAIISRNMLSEFARQAIAENPNDYPALLDNWVLNVGRGQFGATEWLILPQTNMIVAALVGFFIGGAYVCKSRWSAIVTLFLAMAGHVVFVFLLDVSSLLEDPTYTGLRPTHVNAISFLFFWVGTPIIGAIAAFAIHNLRDAFAIQPAKVAIEME